MIPSPTFDQLYIYAEIENRYRDLCDNLAGLASAFPCVDDDSIPDSAEFIPCRDLVGYFETEFRTIRQLLLIDYDHAERKANGTWVDWRPQVEQAETISGQALLAQLGLGKIKRRF